LALLHRPPSQVGCRARRTFARDRSVDSLRIPKLRPD
jgi:hypothetical protein